MSDLRITPSQAPPRGLDTLLRTVVEQTQEEVPFANVLSGILDTANQTDAQAHQNIASMMTGDYDPDVVMIASTKAELALTLTVQVRDRIVEAYNDIMRMQV